MEKRLVLFIVLAVAIVLVNDQLMKRLFPRKPAALPQQMAENKPSDGAKSPADVNAPNGANASPDAKAPPAEPESKAQPAQEPAAEKPPEPGETPEEPEPARPSQRVTLGSADPESPYRMLVTLVNRGAGVERIELNSSNHTDQEDRTGYLGHLSAVDAPDEPGAVVGVVGAGTPAAIAGLAAGDVITKVNDAPITSANGLERAIARTVPFQTIEIGYRRGSEAKTAQAALGRRPMEVIRPSNLEQLIKYWERVGPDVEQAPASNVSSFRLTLRQLDDRKLEDDASELRGIHLEEGVWEIAPGASQSKVEFVRKLDSSNLEIIKRFELAKVEAGQSTAPAYHLNLTVEIRNSGDSDHKIAYRLDGPNGLPTEGWWYASKIAYSSNFLGGWGGAGPRDVAVGSFDESKRRVVSDLISTATIVSQKNAEPKRGSKVSYIGVDAQYFSCVMIPKKEPQQDWFYQWQPIVVGDVPPQRDKQRLTNVSFRLTSDTETLKAKGGALSHTYTVFAGPKQPDLVARYNLDNLIYYGWFGWVSAPMAKLLHGFYFVVRNYGLAVILLTVLVRSAMMPMSRKQVQSAQKMQELQPELKKLQEKFKNDLEGRSRAQRELFMKHNYNPLGGCLLMFVQLPIFIGLYRALSADLELRGAPLLWSGAWCSNLAAPDKLFRWDHFLPGYFVGWLGPYFNLLPLATIVLFIWQQKMFMPPATDEQTRMQQRMMQYMMVFMGVMFFKVPSGLCIYFIASSLWGLAERKLLPKPGAKSIEPGGTSDANISRPAPKPGGNGSRKTSETGRRQREKR